MKKYADLLYTAIFIFTFSAAAVFPAEISAHTKEALKICAFSLIPSLFPFMAITRFFLHLGITERAGYILAPIISPIFGIEKNMCGAFLSGIFGGFPIGIHSAGFIFQNGGCRKHSAERTAALSAVCSFPYILTTVGVRILGNVKNGLILILSELICAFLLRHILNVLFGRVSRQKTAERFVLPPVKSRKKPFSALCAAVTESCAAMLNICGFVTVFYILSSMLSKHISNIYVSALIKGFFEVSSGIEACAPAEFPKNFALCSVILGFSGLSFVFQGTEVCEKYGLSPKEFAVGRIICAFLMPLVTILLLLCLPRKSISAFAPIRIDGASERFHSPSAVILYAAVFSAVILLLLLACVIVRKAERRNKR